MKGQFWSLDAIFAVVIFGFTIVILASSWYAMNSQLSTANNYGVATMQLQLQNLEQSILLQGSPQSWSSQIDTSDSSTWSNIRVGLGNGIGYGNLSQGKIASLMAMSNSDYNASKEALGVGFDYYIAISGSGNFTISMGRNPAHFNTYSIQSANLPVKINNVPYQMQIMVWTNSSFGVV